MIRVKCKACNGTGKAPLSETLAETLELVRGSGVFGVFVEEIAGCFEGIGVTAINNRLEDLRALGLVRRDRRGRRWVYFHVKAKR